MKQRIEYIDSMKGIAIFLVVMGHVIMWTIGAYNSKENALMELYHIIYTFHMPLFMFCSGVLLPKHYSYYTMKNVWADIIKKSRTLLFPFVFAGIVVWYAYQEIYWFLITLFEFILIYYAISWIGKRVGGAKMFESISLAMLSSFLWLFNPQLLIINYYPFLDVGHWPLFFYFTLGIIYTRFNLEKYINQTAYTLSFLFFVVMIVLRTIFKSYFHVGFLIPIAVICLLIYYYNYREVRNSSKSNKVDALIKWMGQNSIQIYVLQYFFRIKIPGLREYYISYLSTNSLGSFIIFQFSITLLESLLIIYLCKISMTIISKSQLLSLILFGKNENTSRRYSM